MDIYFRSRFARTNRLLTCRFSLLGPFSFSCRLLTLSEFIMPFLDQLRDISPIGQSTLLCRPCDEPEPELSPSQRWFCVTCHWRHQVLKNDDEDGDNASEYHEDQEYDCTPRRFILDCWHNPIPVMWFLILQTRGLTSGTKNTEAWIQLSVDAI